jgi:hypothetical protein
MQPIIDEPAHWRGRADNARTRADQMRTSKSRVAMLAIAESYDFLAQQAALRDDKV